MTRNEVRSTSLGGRARRLLVVLAVALAAVGMSTALAKTYTIRIASKMAPSSPEGKGFQKFADLANKYGNGQLKVVVYPSEQLGNTETTLEQLQAGTIDIYVEGGSYLARYVPQMSVESLPFLFKSRDQWVKFLHSPKFQGWLKEVADKANIVEIGSEADFVRGPFRVLVTTKPVHTLADIKGMQVRMPPIDALVGFWKAAGAEPQVLAWTDTYQALSRGTVQGVTSPMALVQSMGFQEVAKYIVRTDEYPQGIAFMTNKHTWDSLPPNLQKALERAHTEASAYASKLMDDDVQKSITEMEAKGAVYSTDFDYQAFHQVALKLYKQWEKEGKLPAGIIDYINSL
ncbi:MAG TPA: TRAP transporter substrate-binding protein [Trueperaceae bacterium]|nr:TRAP transporter substrate-binding protein [Trueperaceae bacterium]